MSAQPAASASAPASVGSLAATIAPQVTQFAHEVGHSDPVTAVGGRTHWHIGGEPSRSAREVTAPAGVWEHEPSEMTVRCGAGTTVAELVEHLASSGQMVPIDASDYAGTVGGVLACGLSGYRRLRYGHVRDLVLQTRHVDAAGKVVTAGGPTVKNVSGYDLPRLLVGSLGTLGLLAEVILRTLPVPAASQWLAGDGDPFAALDVLYRPSSVLWNGNTAWILLEGDPADVEAESAKLAVQGFAPVDDPPSIPVGGRQSARPSDLRDLSDSRSGVDAAHGRGSASRADEFSGEWIAEVGVGLVHRSVPVASGTSSPANVALMTELKRRLDPANRLNPGRKAW